MDGVPNFRYFNIFFFHTLPEDSTTSHQFWESKRTNGVRKHVKLFVGEMVIVIRPFKFEETTVAIFFMPGLPGFLRKAFSKKVPFFILS